MLVVPLILAAVSNLAPLQVEIISPKRVVWPYEPVKITVRATARTRVQVPLVGDSSGAPSAEVWIDYGSGFLLYTDDSREWIEGTADPRTLNAGARYVFTLVLVEGRIGDIDTVPFSAPGRRSLKIRVSNGSELLGESAPLAFDVVAPDERGQQLLTRLQPEPWIMRANPLLDPPEYGRLLGEFPESPYLQWGKRRLANDKITRIGNGMHPDTGERFAEMGQGSSEAAALYRTLATDLLNAASWGPFDEERCDLAAVCFGRAGADAEARDVYRRILEQFPGSEAAERAARVIDTTPPKLALSVSPSTLWPPNHKLQSINVSIQATDDQDPNPRVRLTSIVCDDGCDPARDIAEAAFGTDDRQFELRSERRGTGVGRTYKIAYSAEDAAGNRTTSQAAVTVAHDQGQGQPPGNRGAWLGQGASYRVNDLVTNDGFTWKCIQAHRSQWDWAPPRVPALWVKIPKSKEWDYPAQYVVGAEVTYQGATYTCRQAHTSQAGWTPPTTPALWSRR